MCPYVLGVLIRAEEISSFWPKRHSMLHESSSGGFTVIVVVTCTFTTNSCFVHVIIFQGWIYLHCYQCLESVLPCLFWCKDYSVKQSRAGHHSGLCVRGNPGKSITYYMYNFKNIFNALSKSFKVFHCYETCSSYFSICSFFLDINDINFSDCS